MDRLRSMEVFVAVADAGSFSRAAEGLDLSAVMVGKHVQQLEARLGTRLIQRTTRRQSLTDAGRLFADDCRKVLEQVRWAESSVERLSQTPSGLVRVTAPVTLGGTEVARHLASYLARHPQVRVELVLGDGIANLVEDGFDLAVRIGALADENLVARPLKPYAMVVCASPAYLKRHGRPKAPEDLVRHHCLGHLVWNQRNAWRLMAGGDGSPRVAHHWPAASNFSSNQGQALRMAALGGAGLLLQPEVLVADDLAQGRLVRVLDTHLPPPRAVHLMHVQDHRPLPKLKTLVAHLVKHMGPTAPAG